MSVLIEARHGSGVSFAKQRGAGQTFIAGEDADEGEHGGLEVCERRKLPRHILHTNQARVSIMATLQQQCQHSRASSLKPLLQTEHQHAVCECRMWTSFSQNDVSVWRITWSDTSKHRAARSPGSWRSLSEQMRPNNTTPGVDG